MAERRSNFGRSSSRRVDRVAGVIVSVAALSIVALLGWVVVATLRAGLGEIDLRFLTTAPTRAGRGGGIGPLIVSTLLVLAIAMLTATPIALLAAIRLADRSRQGRPGAVVARSGLIVLAAVPSIVFGLFGNALFCQALGIGYSILAGGLTLGCMILPFMTVTAERALRDLPDDWRLGAAALGIGRLSYLWRIELPAAAPALGSALALGIGRSLAETAALLFTSGYVMRVPTSLFDSGRTLSVHVYDLAMNVPGGASRASATACVLIGLMVLIDGTVVASLARIGAGRSAPIRRDASRDRASRIGDRS